MKNVFPNDLKPNSNIIYRGGIVSNEEMSKKILDIVNTRNQEIIEIPYTYKSKSNIQSWTSDIDVGWLFANKSNYSKHYKKRNHNKDIPVVIAANLDNTFILSSKLTNLICKHFNANLESEIIRISDDPIKCKIYIDPSHISLYQHVKNPSEKMKLNAVKKNGLAIQHIENPSEEVQIAAVENYPNAISQIENPVEKAQLIAVEKNHQTLSVN